MELLHHVRRHRVQFGGPIHGHLCDSILHSRYFDFSHTTSSHDYIDVIITEGKQPLTETTLLAFRHGRNDPTCAFIDGDFWRASWTPHGPGTIRIAAALSPTPQCEGFGPGGDWLAERGADFLGTNDSFDGIVSAHPSVELAQRQFGHLRLGRSSSPYHELLVAVLGQRVTGIEAIRQWRQITFRYGAPAPGPLEGLMVPPDPEKISSTPYYDFHSFGIEKKRADALRAVARHIDMLTSSTLFSLAPTEATRRLQIIDGIGPWSSAVAGGLAFGDPDALLVGDFHVKNTAAWALRGVIRGTDEEMVRDMTPYAGQRHRVMRWLELAGWRAPARGPRQRIVSIARL